MKSGFQTWGDLRVFLAVLRTGSTLAASKTLGLAQPTVARRIDALEHALNLTLFDRDTRGFQPTEAAERLRPHAERVEGEIAALEKEAVRCAQGNTKPILLTAPKANFSHNLAAALADFCDAHPGVRFELVASSDIVDLIAGDADIAIRVCAEITDERLIARKMTTAKSALYGSRAYAERNGLPTSEADLAGHRFIAFSDRFADSLMNRWLLPRIEDGQVTARVSDPEAMTAAVSAGLGLGLVPTTLAEQHGGLLECFPAPDAIDHHAFLVMSPKAWARPEVKAFAKFFVPRFRRYIKAGRATD